MYSAACRSVSMFISSMVTEGSRRSDVSVRRTRVSSTLAPLYTTVTSCPTVREVAPAVAATHLIIFSLLDLNLPPRSSNYCQSLRRLITDWSAISPASNSKAAFFIEFWGSKLRRKCPHCGSFINSSLESSNWQLRQGQLRAISPPPPPPPPSSSSSSLLVSRRL